MQECKLFMNITPYTVISIGTPPPPPENCFSEGRKMVHSVAFWI